MSPTGASVVPVREQKVVGIAAVLWESKGTQVRLDDDVIIWLTKDLAE